MVNNLDIKSWIGGFIAGESCFTFIVNNQKPEKNIISLFTITLKDDDVDILNLIQKTLKIGKVSYHPQNSTCQLYVYPKDNKKIITFCNKYLLGAKKEDFEFWKKGIKYLKNVDISRIKKFKYIKSIMPRERKKGGYNIYNQ